MKRRLLGFVEAVLLIVAGPSAFGADSALPRVFCLSQQALAKSKARLMRSTA